MILRIHDLGAAELAAVGGKAQSLGVLAAAGFDVPRGLVLTTDVLRRFLDGSGLAGELAPIERALERGELPDEAMLTGFRRSLEARPFPEQLAAELGAEMARELPNGTAVAVRSSGTREDLEGASFAGQYETILGVRGAEALQAAVKQCWASLWQPRVLDYASKRGGGATGLEMSVVVQEMVEAEVAGVMFTVNPVTGRETEVLIESVFGLGESLVSGRTNADRFVVEVGSGEVLERAIGDKSLAITGSGAGTEERELSGDEATAPTLTDAQLTELSERAAAIQEHYGRPMDVEWAYAGGRLAILQARPITQLAFAPELGEWTTADFRDGGVSSAACAPLMASLYEASVERSMPDYFKALKLIPKDYEAKWLQVFFARPYWNLGEVKKALESLPGFDETAFYQDLGVDYDDGGERKVTPVTVTGVIRALPTLFALKRSYREVLEHNRAFAARFEEAKAPYDLTPDQLAAVPRDELSRKLRSLIEGLYLETETSYFTTIYNTSNSKTDFKPVFDKVNKVAGGELSQIDLMGGLVDLSHLRAMKALHELAGELAAAGGEVTDEVVAEFAWRWRHHGKKELDIRVPRWSGDHAFVRQMIERAVAAYSADGDPERNEARQHQRYVDARRAIERKLRWRPLLRRSFGKKLDLVRTYAWWREEMRDYSSYAYYLVHSWAAEAGRRLAAEGAIADPADVWYLPYPELLDAVDGALAGDELTSRVRAGRRYVASYERFDNPNEIGTHVRAGGGEVSDDALRGTPCSPGRVTGRARVVRTLEEADAIEPGDILVTVFTDPGWTPLFSSISAVVTETGGVLSHAAVISREYGIPAVLAVSGATRMIPDGATITVDGASGAIEIE